MLRYETIMQRSHGGVVRFTEQLSNSYGVFRDFAVSGVGVAVCVGGATGGVLEMRGDEEVEKNKSKNKNNKKTGSV